MIIAIGNFLNYILNFLKFQVPQILNYECFSYVDGRLSSFQKTSHKKKFIKRIYSPMFYKIDFGVLKIQHSFIKTKTQFIELNNFILNSSTLI
jgi:hypothetical protein